MNRAHKTNGQEFRDSLREMRARNPAGMRRLTAGERRERFGEVTEFLPDEEIPFGLDRATKDFPGVKAENVEALERMLDDEGLPKILRTLRELLDARKPHEGAAFEAFEPQAEDEAAEVGADELENLLLRLARRVQA